MLALNKQQDFKRLSVVMKNILLGGKLPSILGFDHGPILLEGSRASIVQCAVYEAHGRTMTFCPSWRYVADLGKREVHTVLAGGPSARRTSGLYTSDVERWLAFEHKTLVF